MTTINHFFSLKNCLFLALLISLSMMACVKESLVNETTTIQPEPQQLTTTTIHGRVVDENGNPITDAVVNYQSGDFINSISTDEEGYFFFQNVRNKGKSAYFTIASQGKFDAFRRMSVLPNKYNYTEIIMNDKTSIGQVLATNGGTLSHASSAQITLPANGIINADGTTYAGIVDVVMAWIDPSAADLAQRMVGDLSGIDSAGNPRSLGSFGMLQVELLDNNGEELNLAEGSEAQLVFPVPASMQGNAPATIPLWSYDELQGTWIQEGEATYTDGKYIGMVSHFSSWNVDCLSDPIEITGQVNYLLPDEIAYGSAYLKVLVCGDKFGQKGGWLCDDGAFLFYNFPKNEKFDLKIIDRCGQTLYQESYGPFAENTDIGDIQINANTETTAVTGNAVDCAGNAITEGYASVLFGDSYYNFPINEEGVFKFSLDLCEGATVGLSVINTATQLSSATIPIDSSQPLWTLDDLVVCDEILDFIEVSINGETPALYTPGVAYEASDSSSYIAYSVKTSNNFISVFLDLPGDIVVNEAAKLNYFIYRKSDNTQNFFNYRSSLDYDIFITFSKYDNFSGGECRGTFEGEAIDLNNNEEVVTVSGSFHVSIE